MRHDVTTFGYLFRKALDNILRSLSARQQLTPDTFASGLGALSEPFPTRAPAGWLPLYTMVTFRPDISYAAVQRKAAQQNQILSYARWTTAALAAGSVGITCIKLWQRIRGPSSAA